MYKSYHMKKRMSQRNISDEMITLLTNFGSTSTKGDKTILDKKILNDLEFELRSYIKTIEYIKKKGGLICVESQNCQITSYFLNSFIKKHS